MQNAHWFHRLITPPSSRDFDERYQQINSRSIRDAFMAIMVLLLLLAGSAQLAHFSAFSRFAPSVTLALVISVGLVTLMISRILRGGGDWRRYRWSALIALSLAPLFAAIEFVPDIVTGAGIQPLVIATFFIVYLAFPISIILLSVRYDWGEVDEYTFLSGKRTLIGIGSISLLLTAAVVFFSFRGGGLQGSTVAMLSFACGLLGILLVVARLCQLPLPRILQNAPQLSSEEKALVNKRILWIAVFLMLFSLPFALGAFHLF